MTRAWLQLAAAGGVSLLLLALGWRLNHTGPRAVA
jgi:hypothetical protein